MIIQLIHQALYLRRTHLFLRPSRHQFLQITPVANLLISHLVSRQAIQRHQVHSLLLNLRAFRHHSLHRNLRSRRANLQYILRLSHHPYHQRNHLLNQRRLQRSLQINQRLSLHQSRPVLLPINLHLNLRGNQRVFPPLYHQANLAHNLQVPLPVLLRLNRL